LAAKLAKENGFRNYCIDNGIPNKKGNPQTIQGYYDYTGQLFHSIDDRTFIKNPRLSPPSEDPFQMIDIEGDLETYITRSTAPVGISPDMVGYYPEYWGDTVSIDIFNSVLKLNIMVLKKRVLQNNENNPYNVFNVVYGVFTTQTIEEIADLGCNLNEWNKYLFVYNPGDHYTLLTFTYSTKKDSSTGKSKITDNNTYTIFKKDDYILPPPLYMFFLIFYTKYVGSEIETKNNFNFFKNFFDILNYSYETIKQSNTEAGYITIENFNTWYPREYFQNILDTYKWQPPPPSKPGRRPGTRNYEAAKLLGPTRSSTRLNPGSGSELITSSNKGGAPPFKNRQDYYNQYPNYNNRYPNNYRNNFLRSDLTRDLSKIGYYISIDMELKKGSPLTPEEIKQSKCTQKWNAVRKAFANFTGKTYTIPPVYDYSNKQTLKNRSNTQPSNVTKSNRPNAPPPQTNDVNPTKKVGGTRKIQNVQKKYSGKHSKTRKLIE
jgi:hypothetical protein